MVFAIKKLQIQVILRRAAVCANASNIHVRNGSILFKRSKRFVKRLVFHNLRLDMVRRNRAVRLGYGDNRSARDRIAAVAVRPSDTAVLRCIIERIVRTRL